MKRELLQGQYIHVFYHQDKRYLHAWVHVETATLHEKKLVEELDYLMKHCKTYQPTLFILNIKDFKAVISKDVKKSIESNFSKLGLSQGLQKLAIVFGDNLHNSITFEEATGSRKERAYTMASFTNENQAIAWGLAQKNIAC